MPITHVSRVHVDVRLIPVSIQCNVCGHVRTVAEHGAHEFMADMHRITLAGSWGDGFPMDGQTIQFVTCGGCLETWTQTFAVPVDSGHDFAPPLDSTAVPVIHSETGEAWRVWGDWTYPEGVDFTWPDDDGDIGGDNIPVPGVWEHYKGLHYEVLRVVRNYQNPDEALVYYRALYGDSQDFVRPLAMWGEKVELDGRLVPRFHFLGRDGEFDSVGGYKVPSEIPF